MTLFIITGTSSGIGYSLSAIALKQGYTVFGISRRNTIEHKNYKHFFCDLAEISSLDDLEFWHNLDQYEKVVLINNAGWLGEIKPFAKVQPENLQRAFNINTIAPAILAQKLINVAKGKEQKKLIINISSGAANYPVASWSSYCSSKAALNMLTRSINTDHPEITCWAIAPGVVDTDMQAELRAQEDNDFPDKERFVNYHKQGELNSSKGVASKILHLIENPQSVSDSVFSLRQL